MSDYRVHCQPVAVSAAEIHLSPQESHHLVVVNRASAGARVVAFDGHGREWETQLVKADKRGARLLIRATHTAPPLPCTIELAQALPKGTLMDSIVQKATELGVRRIHPILSGRSQVHLDGDRRDRKRERWQTSALEAAKQCGNPWLPEIAPIADMTAFLGHAPTHDLGLIASLQPEARSLKVVLEKHREHHGRMPERTIILIGPEGDFSPDELSAAKAAGFQAVTLGPLVLRCETAAVAAIAILRHELLSAKEKEGDLARSPSGI